MLQILFSLLSVKYIFVWLPFPGIHSFEVNKNLQLQITLHPRYAKYVFRNTDCEAIYHFRVNS